MSCFIEYYWYSVLFILYYKSNVCMFVCISRGDQLLEVDSVSLRHAALSEAYAILSECGPGPVSLIISRHPNPKVSAYMDMELYHGPSFVSI